MESKCVITPTVKTSPWYSSKILQSWQNNLNKPIIELIHSFAPQGYHKTDRISLADFKSCNSLSCFGRLCFLSCYLTQSYTHFLDNFLITGCILNTHIDNYFFQMRNSHRIFDSQV